MRIDLEWSEDRHIWEAPPLPSEALAPPPPLPEPGKRLLSPSQIDIFRDCPRKWAFRYIAGNVPEPFASAKLGTRIHSIAEDYLIKGINPAPFETMDVGWQSGPAHPGQIFLAGLSYLPKPGACNVERYFRWQSPGGHYFRGYKDLEYWELPDGSTAPPFDASGSPVSLPGARLVVSDHKSTSSFQWAKTPDDLRKDSQAMIYAAEGCEVFNLTEIELRWIYYRTRGNPEAREVRLTVLKDEAFGFVTNQLDPLAEACNALHSEGPRDPNDIPANPGSCDKYGGCPYRDQCILSPLDHFKTSVNTMDEISKLLGATAAPPVPAPAPVAAPPVPAPGGLDEATKAAVINAIKQGTTLDQIRMVFPQIDEGTFTLLRQIAHNESQALAASYAQSQGKPYHPAPAPGINPPGSENIPELPEPAPAEAPALPTSSGIPDAISAALATETKENRDVLKSACISLGIGGITESSRNGWKSLAALVEEHYQGPGEGSESPPSGNVPPPLPPTAAPAPVASEDEDTDPSELPKSEQISMAVRLAWEIALDADSDPAAIGGALGALGRLLPLL